MNPSQLKKIREYELELIVDRFPACGRVLEIGAGSGWQALLLSRHGFDVEAVDLKDAMPQGEKMWPVREFDGCSLPFPENHFDAVFSSNVLEHVKELSTLLDEMKRVLKPGGIMVHILPTSSWRLWTSVFHYLFLISSAIRKGAQFAARHRLSVPAERNVERGPRAVSMRSWRGYIARLLAAERHGSRGGALWEIYGFSRWRWYREFSVVGQSIQEHDTTRLYYSGYGVLPFLTLASRRRLSRVMGSACHIFVLRPKESEVRLRSE